MYIIVIIQSLHTRFTTAIELNTWHLAITAQDISRNSHCMETVCFIKYIINEGEVIEYNL